MVSVLLALAGDAWWGQRQEMRRERIVLAGLEEDFTATLDAISQNRRARQRQDSIAAVLIGLGAGDPEGISAGKMDTLLATMLPAGRFVPVDATLTALLSSDGLGVIGNEELRRKLAVWPGLIAELRRNEGQAGRLFETTFMPYLHENVPMRTMDAIGSPEVGSLPHSAFPVDARHLLGDLRFENYVNDILFYARSIIVELDEIEQHTRETLALIRSELDKT